MVSRLRWPSSVGCPMLLPASPQCAFMPFFFYHLNIYIQYEQHIYITCCSCYHIDYTYLNYVHIYYMFSRYVIYQYSMHAFALVGHRRSCVALWYEAIILAGSISSMQLVNSLAANVVCQVVSSTKTHCYDVSGIRLTARYIKKIDHA